MVKLKSIYMIQKKKKKKKKKIVKGNASCGFIACYPASPYERESSGFRNPK